jgi:hypothetical protein
MPQKYIQRQCSKHGITEFVLEGRGYYRCKTCRNSKVIAWRKEAKQKLIERFGGKCEICGYNRCARSLHFHHIDPGMKVFGIAKGGNTKSWPRILKEAQKCVLLCSNCHGEIEDGMLNVSEEIILRSEDDNWLLADITSFYKKAGSQKSANKAQKRSKKQIKKTPNQTEKRVKRENKCIECDKKIGLHSLRCLSCSNKLPKPDSRKVERPQKEELEKMVWEMPTTKIAQQYGVSDKAVGKWVKAYGIEKPGRGYWAKQN